MLRWTASSSAGVIGMLTRKVQSGGLAIDQRDSLGSASASLVLPRAKLPHCQSSARGANPARRGISLHIAADRQKMVVRLHRERFETTLVKVTATGGVAMGVPALV